MELLDLEMSFEELKENKLAVAEYFALPINADISKFEKQITKIGFPLWLKLNSWEHKLHLGGVEKEHSIEELKKTHAGMKKRFPDKKFILQENVSGIEIIAGIKTDRTFGRVLMLGSGGSFAEIIKDTGFVILPAEKPEIENALKELKIYPILLEKNANINKLIDLIKQFSELNIEEADLNPIIVNEKEAVIVDARISLKEE